MTEGAVSVNRNAVDDETAHGYSHLDEGIHEALGLSDTQRVGVGHGDEFSGSGTVQQVSYAAHVSTERLEKSIHHVRCAASSEGALEVLVFSLHERIRMNPALHHLRQTQQPEGVSGGRGIHDDELICVLL